MFGFVDAVLRSTLRFYMENRSLPLPTPEEVLMCYSSTTAEEVAGMLLMLLMYSLFQH